VVLVAFHFYAGRSVWLDHGAGLLTAYLHLSAAAVAVGDTVARGQVLGRVGRTGRVTAPHLHWSALYGRVGFDPLELLGPRARELLGETTGG
jgi:murein DD-endopeptidase MepM/ murein hydrolase activator NlpD